jgi:hypothetical protein
MKNKLTQFRLLTLPLILVIVGLPAFSQSRRPPAVGRIAVVVDERLAALRTSPDLSGNLVLRLSRGRLVAVTGERRSRDGVVFYRVTVTRRRRGWLQRESAVSASKREDEERLLRLIEASRDFDRLARARIFLNTFQRSPLRPKVLLLFGDAAEDAGLKLSRDAIRRLDSREMIANGGEEFSYFLNYNGLDRYNRQGVRFVFDKTDRCFHYDGASWHELVRRYPKSPEAIEARNRLVRLNSYAKGAEER